jgi:hypothetical protein
VEVSLELKFEKVEVLWRERGVASKWQSQPQNSAHLGSKNSMNSPRFFTVTSFEDRTVAETVYKEGGDAAKSFF